MDKITIKQAEELRYSDTVIEKIKKAKSDTHIGEKRDENLGGYL